MFADNDRISQRQLLRQMILALLGAWLLFLAGGVCQAGQNGLAGMTLGFLLLAGWLLLLIRNAGVYENMEHYIGKAGRLLVIIVYLSFLVLTGSFLLRKISSLCGEYLISGISPEFLGLLLLLAAGAGIRNDIQQRARLAEIFYPFVMAGFVLMLDPGGISYEGGVLCGCGGVFSDGSCPGRMENSGSGGGSGGASVSSWTGGAGEKIEKAVAGRAGKGVAFSYGSGGDSDRNLRAGGRPPDGGAGDTADGGDEAAGKISGTVRYRMACAAAVQYFVCSWEPSVLWNTSDRNAGRQRTDFRARWEL